MRFVLDILNPAVDGLAFGRAGRRYIMLSRGLADLHDREPALFRAVVLHELAHIRNRDLDLTAFTLGLWRSFVVVILAPGLLITIIDAVYGLPPTSTASDQHCLRSGAVRLGHRTVLAAPRPDHRDRRPGLAEPVHGAAGA